MKEKKRLKLGRNRLVAFSLAAIIAVGIGNVTASARTYEIQESSMESRGFESFWDSLLNNSDQNTENGDSVINVDRYNKALATVANKNVNAYTRKSIVISGRETSVKGITVNGIEYIPFRQSANIIGGSYIYNSKTGNSTLTSPGLTLSATSGNYVVYANDRPLFSTSPTLIMNDGRMYIPAEIFAKAVGMRMSVSSGSVSLSGSYSPLKSASEYYRSDEVLWLARIIHAESRGEPLLGQVAVGNVVLNRVKSSSYPNTIYGVIFDRKYGVQFSPVLDGTIYNTPSYNSTLAAKICLEGFDISEGALFFLRPEMSTSSWIPNNRPYSFSIGKHDFYK